MTKQTPMPNMLRDQLGSPLPQQTYDAATKTYTAMATGDTTGIDFSKHRLLRDQLGSPLPYQYFDVALNRFVPGVLGGSGGGSGAQGADGRSAYQIAVLNGFVGTEEEWLASLKGADGMNGSDGRDGANGNDGLSAYELAIADGFTGSITEWLLSLKGTNGSDGEDGIDGAAGANGRDGLSVYEIALQNGFIGSENDWLLSLKGADGRDGNDGAQGIQGEQGQRGADGIDGDNGLSVYEVALANGFVGTETAWLASLKGDKGETGEKGQDGTDGKSAYDIAVAKGFTGSEADWLLSLKGEKGDKGETGSDANVTAASITAALGYTPASTEAVTTTENGVMLASDKVKIDALGTVYDKNVGTTVGAVPIVGSDGKLDSTILPALAITEVHPVASQEEMLALPAQKGDVAIRSDLNKSFILSSDDASIPADWQELLTPTSEVLSVAGKKGAVVLTKEDVGLGNVDNTSDSDKPVSTATQAALDKKVDVTTLGNHIADRSVHLTQQERTMVIDSARFLDTRDDNFTPSYYRLKSTGIHKEFKSVGAIGLTLELAGGSYAAVETIVHYAHLSGGSLTQIAYCQSGLVFIRKSNNDDSGWFGWVRQINQNELNPHIARITALENTVADLRSRIEVLENK